MLGRLLHCAHTLLVVVAAAASRLWHERRKWLAPSTRKRGQLLMQISPPRLRYELGPRHPRTPRASGKRLNLTTISVRRPPQGHQRQQSVCQRPRRAPLQSATHNGPRDKRPHNCCNSNKSARASGWRAPALSSRLLASNSSACNGSVCNRWTRSLTAAIPTGRCKATNASHTTGERRFIRSADWSCGRWLQLPSDVRPKDRARVHLQFQFINLTATATKRTIADRRRKRAQGRRDRKREPLASRRYDTTTTTTTTTNKPERPLMISIRSDRARRLCCCAVSLRMNSKSDHCDQLPWPSWAGRQRTGE